MGTTTRKRRTELAEVQRRGFEARRPFHYGEFWQACGKAGLATYLLGLGIYLAEVVQTWQVGGDEDKT